MLIKSVVLAVLLALSLNVKAQYFEHDLRKHKWIAVEGFQSAGVFDWILTFDQGTVCFTMKEKGGTNVVSEIKYDMYLTPRTKGVTFDPDQVGKDTFGKFILMGRIKDDDEKTVQNQNMAEILNLDDNTLTLYLNRKNKVTFSAMGE